MLDRARTHITSLLLSLLAATLLLVSCDSKSGEEDRTVQQGSLKAIEAAQASSKEALISGREVRAAGRSPAGTVLRWWQLVQFSARTVDILPFYDADARPSLRQLTKQLAATRYYFVDRKPFITDQQIDGSNARVFFLLARRPGDTQVDPSVVALTRSASSWQLADNDLVARRYKTEQSFADERSRGRAAP
jgi:hypothetical protein